MSQSVTVVLSDAAYSTLELRALAAAQSPAVVAAAALEKQFGPEAISSQTPGTPADHQAARERFERHFGAINLGYSTGTDNEEIDSDLAREYADRHEGG